MNFGDIWFRALIRVDANEIKRAAAEAGAEIDKSGLDAKGKSIGDTFKKDVSGGFKEAGTAASRFGSIGQGAVIGIASSLATAGLSAAIGAIHGVIDKFGDAITLASDKAENLNKVKVVFGEASGSIEAFAKTAVTSLGISESAALKALGTFGNLLTAMGMSRPAAADMAIGINQLAADLSSFNNIPTADVLEKIRAGLVGETEPLRALGVNLSAASIGAKALKMGLADSTEALTPAMKAQAAYALMIEQTSSAQGDFARTSDGLANSQRIAAAKQEEAWTRIGDKLLPIAQKVMPMVQDAITGVVDVIGDVIDAIVDWVEHNQPLIRQAQDFAKFIFDVWIKYLKIVADVVGELGYRLGGLIGIIVDTLGVIVDLSGAMAAVLRGDWDTAVEHAELAGDRLIGLQANLQRVAGDGNRRFLDQQAAAYRDREVLQARHYAETQAQGDEAWRRMTGQAAGALTEIAGLPGENPMDPLVPPDVGPVLQAVEIVKVKLGELTGAIGDMVKGSNDEWQSWKDAPRESAEDIEKRIGKLTRRLDKLNNVDLATLGPSALAAWAAAKDATQTELGQLTSFVENKSEIVAFAVPEALRDSKATQTEQWLKTTGIGRIAMHDLAIDARTFARRTAGAYAQGFIDSRSTITTAARYAVAGARGVFHAESPPGPESPLHDIDKWAFRTFAAWAEGFASAADYVEAKVADSMGRVGDRVAGTLLRPGLIPAPAYSYGGHPSMLAAVAAPYMARGGLPDFAPALGARRALEPMVQSLELSVGPPASAGGVPFGGDTINLTQNLQFHGLPIRAETPAEVARQVARLSTLGELPKRKR